MKNPGATAFTRTPCGASSTASHRVRFSTAALGSPVADHLGQRAVRRHRRDVDDRPRHHRGAEDLTRDHRAVEVEPDNLVESRRWQLEERPLADRRRGDIAAGGVDERVDPAEAIEQGCTGAFELGGFEDVGLEHDRGVVEAPRQRLERLASSCKR